MPISDLKNNGFSKISGIFSQYEITKLRHECLKILESGKNVEKVVKS